MNKRLRSCVMRIAASTARVISAPTLALHQPGHKSGEQWKAHLPAESPNATDAINSDIEHGRNSCSSSGARASKLA